MTRKVLVIGLGLIGGSIALALQKHQKQNYWLRHGRTNTRACENIKYCA